MKFMKYIYYVIVSVLAKSVVMGADYSTYLNDVKTIPSNICVLHTTSSAIFGINLNFEITKGIRKIYRDTWGTELSFKSYSTNIIKFYLHKTIHNTINASDSAKSKQLFCRFHKMFCLFGWSLVGSPTLTFQMSLSTWFYFKQINPFMVQMGEIENNFCIIGLSNTDKFQFIEFPKELENPVIDCIKSNWHRGVQHVEILDKPGDVWVVKMNGNPWSCQSEQSLDARFLVLSLIRFMSHHNWRLVNSTAMKPDASDTMFFRCMKNAYNVSIPDSMPEYYFLLALMGNNYFSILGGDSVIIDTISKSCMQYEVKGITGRHDKHNYPAIELVSSVWSRRYEKEMETKRLMTLIFQDLTSIGWLPIESIDCTRSIRDLSSIAFVRVPPARMMYFCLTPRKYNGICLINAIEEVQNIIYSTFIQFYVIEKSHIKRSIYGIAQSIDFHGDPFRGGNNTGVILFQVALAAIISALAEANWHLVVSVDTSNETKTERRNDHDKTIKWSLYGLWFAKLLV